MALLDVSRVPVHQRQRAPPGDDSAGHSPRPPADQTGPSPQTQPGPVIVETGPSPQTQPGPVIVEAPAAASEQAVAEVADILQAVEELAAVAEEGVVSSAVGVGVVEAVPQLQLSAPSADASPQEGEGEEAGKEDTDVEKKGEEETEAVEKEEGEATVAAVQKEADEGKQDGGEGQGQTTPGEGLRTAQVGRSVFPLL